MPSVLVLLPPAVLALVAAGCWAAGLAHQRGGSELGAAGAWLAAALAVAVWLVVRGVPVELVLPVQVSGVQAGLLLDAVTFIFELLVLVPHALLATFQRRRAGEAALTSLAASAALLGILSDRLLLAALGLATCATLVAAVLRREEGEAGEPGGGFSTFWPWLTGAGLLALWAGAAIQVAGGTSAYAAVPVSALQAPIFLLLTLATVLAAGLVPWRGWPSALWARARPEGAAVAVALVVPLGFLLLVRTYSFGAGRWPASWLNTVLEALGVAVALGAALRAQAAPDRNGFLAETVPLNGGLALLALALGTPFGVAAALGALAGSAVLAGLAPLLPAGDRPSAMVALAVVAGAPPALIFGGRLLALQAAFEAGGVSAYLSAAGAGAWLLGIAAAARVARLPDGRASSGGAGAWTGLGLAVASGIGLGAFESLVAVPAAGVLMKLPPTLVASAGQVQAALPAGGWDPVLSGLPLLALAAVAAVIVRRWGWARPAAVPQPALDPFFRLSGRPLETGIKAMVGRLGVPDEYRSLVQVRPVVLAMTTSRPWVWAAITVVLAVLVTR